MLYWKHKVMDKTVINHEKFHDGCYLFMTRDGCFKAKESFVRYRTMLTTLVIVSNQLYCNYSARDLSILFICFLLQQTKSNVHIVVRFPKHIFSFYCHGFWDLACKFLDKDLIFRKPLYVHLYTCWYVLKSYCVIFCPGQCFYFLKLLLKLNKSVALDGWFCFTRGWVI